jgi:hypothetical protein
MASQVLLDAGQFCFPVTIRISYPAQEGMEATLTASGSLQIRSRGAVSTAEGTADAGDEADEADETRGTATVEVILPAFLLERESGFFRAALTNGFRETHSRVINYHAQSAEGAA